MATKHNAVLINRFHFSKKDELEPANRINKESTTLATVVD